MEGLFDAPELVVGIDNELCGLADEVAGASLCQTLWLVVVSWRLAGPVSDWSEVPVSGCESAALDIRVVPECPAGSAASGGVVVSLTSWR